MFQIRSLTRLSLGLALAGATAYVVGVWLLKVVLTVGLQVVPAG